MLRLILEIRDIEPLEGNISLIDETGRPFTGWTGLAAGIAHYLSDWQQAPPGAPACGPSSDRPGRINCARNVRGADPDASSTSTRYVSSAGNSDPRTKLSDMSGSSEA
jgi:hypothetical protein